MTIRQLPLFHRLPLAVEGIGMRAAKGFAARVAQDEPDTDWQPL